MPSIDHDGPVQLLENAPDLSPRLLRALGVKVPDYIEARISNIDFTQLVPTEYQADQVLTLWTGRKKPELGIINEVQRAPDPRKKYSWPLYNVAMRAKYECDVCLLVIALDEAVARWAREPIEGIQPGCHFVPLVMGRSRSPGCGRTRRRSGNRNWRCFRRWRTATPRGGFGGERSGGGGGTLGR